MSRTVVGIFNSYDNAESAARQIKDQGLRTADISIVAKQENQGDTTGTTATMGGQQVNPNEAPAMTGSVPTTVGTPMWDRKDANRGAKNDNISDGVVTGGMLGGLAGLLIGAGSMVIPGLGIIAAAGPITGLISGAVTGGIVGGLVDLGIPENRSRQYETDIKAGKILFSMKTDDDKIDQVANVLRNNGAVSVDSY